MKIRVFSQSQTSITCEEFLSLDSDAYQMIYRKKAPTFEKGEMDQLIERIFYTIVEKDTLTESFLIKFEPYPFEQTLLPEG